MAGDYRFDCPSCGESVLVDDRIRESILADGCLICLAPATVDDFEVAEPAESSP